MNTPGAEGGLENYNAGHDLPTLQDNATVGATTAYNAQRWYLYILAPGRELQLMWLDLDLPGEADRLVGHIDAVLAAEGL